VRSIASRLATGKRHGSGSHAAGHVPSAATVSGDPRKQAPTAPAVMSPDRRISDAVERQV